MDERDIRRDPSFDLSSAQSWQCILEKIKTGHYDVLMLSPPCGTYSRARHRSLGKGGPVPLRSSLYPWGFPWLSTTNQAKAQLANFFVKQCFLAIESQIQANKFWMLEHPEDLGKTKSGEFSASIWQLPELRALVDMSGSTWAVHQCIFGAETSKPTRLASNLPACAQLGKSWPSLSSGGDYAGPLLCCPHGSRPPLIGFRHGQFATSGAEAYPSAFCKYLAQFILSALAAANTGDISSSEDAEQLSRRLLQGSPTVPSALSVALRLPREDAHKATMAQHGGAFYAGAFLRGGLYGLRAACRSHPNSVQVFTALLRQHFPGRLFSSLGVFVNIQTAMHRDSRNAAHPNLLFALSSFTGGQVWCESPEGTVSRIVQGVPTPGVLLEVADSPQVLDAHRCFHCTEPWEGTRVVLIGFSVDVSGLPTPDVQLLLHLGFVLVPAPSEGDRLDPNPAFPPLPPCSLVDPDLPRPVLAARDRLDPNPAFPPLPPSGCVDPDLPRHVHAAQLEVLAQGPSSAASPTHQVPLSPAQAHMAQAPASDSVDPREVRVISSEEESSGDEAFDPFTSRCSGPPIKCRHGAGDRELVDGFGLCSPGRWRPLQRGRLCTGRELDHARSVQEALRGFVLSELRDPRKAAFALASGHLKASPFSDAGLGRLGSPWQLCCPILSWHLSTRRDSLSGFTCCTNLWSSWGTRTRRFLLMVTVHLQRVCIWETSAPLHAHRRCTASVSTSEPWMSPSSSRTWPTTLLLSSRLINSRSSSVGMSVPV